MLSASCRVAAQSSPAFEELTPGPTLPIVQRPPPQRLRSRARSKLVPLLSISKPHSGESAENHLEHTCRAWPSYRTSRTSMTRTYLPTIELRLRKSLYRVTSLQMATMLLLGLVRITTLLARPLVMLISTVVSSTRKKHARPVTTSLARIALIPAHLLESLSPSARTYQTPSSFDLQ